MVGERTDSKRTRMDTGIVAETTSFKPRKMDITGDNDLAVYGDE